MDLKKKKLLILGANPETVPLVKTSKRLGIQTFVTDHNPHAIAKTYADKSFNINGLDVKALIKAVKIEKIDGVLVGVADRLIEPYQKVCEALKFPCYATSEQCKVFTNKKIFNKKCAEFEISPIPNISLDKNYKNKKLNSLQFPLFVKPVDGNSGKGMSVCKNESEIAQAIEKAKSESQSQQFLVERYMECDDMLIYYTFKNKKIYLSATADRFTCREQGNVSRVCLGATYPSKHQNLYLETLHAKMCKMFCSLKIKNGVFLISAFVEKDKMFVYDPGFRLQGEAPDIHVKNINGFDQKEMLIRYALTGSMGTEDLDHLNDPTFHGQNAGTVWFLGKQGKIKKIAGLDTVENDKAVTEILVRLHEGDFIDSKMIGTEAQVLCRVYLQCASKRELNKKIIKVQSTIKAWNQQNQQIVLNGFSPENI